MYKIFKSVRISSNVGSDLRLNRVTGLKLVVKMPKEGYLNC